MSISMFIVCYRYVFYFSGGVAGYYGVWGDIFGYYGSCAHHAAFADGYIIKNDSTCPYPTIIFYSYPPLYEQGCIGE